MPGSFPAYLCALELADSNQSQARQALLISESRHASGAQASAHGHRGQHKSWQNSGPKYMCKAGGSCILGGAVLTWQLMWQVIGGAAGQTTVQTTIGFFDVTPVTVYGQAPTYRISFPRPTSSPTPPTTGPPPPSSPPNH